MALMGFKADLLVTNAMFFLLTQVTSYIKEPLKEVKSRTKFCDFNGFKADLLVTNAMFFLLTQVTCYIKEPLKEVKSRTKFCDFNGFKADLLVTNAMFFLLTQVTCYTKEPMKKRLNPGQNSVTSMDSKPTTLLLMRCSSYSLW